jgi:hypothetical protein
MSIAPPKSDRQVFPRWRGYGESATTGELNPPERSGPRPWETNDAGLKRREQEWSLHQRSGFAADLVNSAVVLGSTDLAVDAARVLLDRGDLHPLLEAAARRLVAEAEIEDGGRVESVDVSVSQSISIGREVHLARRATRRSLRNAIRWSELARVHTIAGYADKAADAMRVARALAPENRYVLRCAARLEIHRHDAEKAHSILARASATASDPWLLAAEIATAAAADRRSKLVRRAQRLLGAGTFDARSLSELASALGTLEARDGDQRAARKLFRQALVSPTDNSIAQAEWASQHVSGLELPPAALSHPSSWEARALDAGGRGEWQVAVSESWMWHQDQPFARRPAEFGSYHASAGRDFKSGAMLAEAGLRANPREFLLLNNASFCLGSLNELDRAYSFFSRIDETKLTGDQRATYLATKGLLAYRSGNRDAGLDLYMQSIDTWKGGINRVLALIMLAREELLAMAPEASEFVAAAKRAGAQEGDEKDMALWLQQLDAAAEGQRALSPTTLSIASPSASLPTPRTPEER